MYMIMLIRILGPGYTVWDKAATIRFRSRAGRRFRRDSGLDRAEIDEIRRLLESAPSMDRLYTVDLVDAQGVVHATVEKTIFIRKNA